LGNIAMTAGQPTSLYAAANQTRHAINAEMKMLFERFDVIVTPTTSTVAPSGQSPPKRLSNGIDVDRFTAPASLAGLPAISVPCGWSNGLPFGIQIIGRPWCEASCFAIASAIERFVEFNKGRSHP